jgi:hypothetical protein
MSTQISPSSSGGNPRWSMLDSSTRALVERELQHLERLLIEYVDLLRNLPSEDPGLVDRTALGAVLQAFYLGVEAVFQRIAKRIDENMPSTSEWHRQLLNQMSGATARRPAVISIELADRLDPYLGFRHLARHTYTECVASSTSWLPSRRPFGKRFRPS